MKKGTKRKTTHDQEQPKRSQENKKPRAKRAKPQTEPEYFEDKRNLVYPYPIICIHIYILDFDFAIMLLPRLSG